ncbi:hypothetical protein CI102_538 [Trichoderma harzianum]|nr:hypothetical protein CI102_538 [Trichoderma harzianum]
MLRTSYIVITFDINNALSFIAMELHHKLQKPLDANYTSVRPARGRLAVRGSHGERQSLYVFSYIYILLLLIEIYTHLQCAHNPKRPI